MVRRIRDYKYVLKGIDCVSTLLFLYVAARKIDLLGYLQGESDLDSSSAFNLLERASGILQHHDGVSGTAKQHVADDYTRKIYQGMNATAVYLSNIVSNMFKPLFTSQHTPLNFTYCDVDNCMASPLLDSDSLLLAIFNPLSFKSDTLLSVRTSSIDRSYFVETFSNGSWVSIPSSQMDYDKNPSKVQLLYFKANLPALGFSMYRVTATTVKSYGRNIQNEMQNRLSYFTSSDRLRRGLSSFRPFQGDSGDLVLDTQFFNIKFKR